MLLLNKEFTKSNFNYVQLDRNNYKAIYLVTNLLTSNVHYEVIRIRINKETLVFANIVPEREHYPRSEEFGTLGFCYQNYDQALAKYVTLQPIKKRETTNE